jgi:hypothetical protein
LPKSRLAQCRKKIKKTIIPKMPRKNNKYAAPPIFTSWQAIEDPSPRPVKIQTKKKIMVRRIQTPRM